MVQNIHLASRINTRIFPVAEGFYEIFPNIFFLLESHSHLYTQHLLAYFKFFQHSLVQ